MRTLVGATVGSSFVIVSGMSGNASVSAVYKLVAGVGASSAWNLTHNLTESIPLATVFTVS